MAEMEAEMVVRDPVGVDLLVVEVVREARDPEAALPVALEALVVLRAALPAVTAVVHLRVVRPVATAIKHISLTNQFISAKEYILQKQVNPHSMNHHCFPSHLNEHNISEWKPFNYFIYY